MAKILVTEVGEHRTAAHPSTAKLATRVPFLRGILTRSLQDAGLSFDDAYRLASVIRQELAGTVEISTADLRDRVLRHLRHGYGAGVVHRYQNPTPSPVTVLVRDAGGHTAPFSRGRHRRHLECCGLSSEVATAITGKMWDHLTKKAIAKIDSRYLGWLTYRFLHRDLGAEVARRYMMWVDFLRSDRPLLLLIGGVPGSGKSTIATEIANRLEIVRTQSTDMLREVMRMMVPQRLLPVLYTSSFNAWTALPVQTHTGMDHDTLLADGYLAQVELLSLGCEAVLHRALQERVSLILEGVHVHPSLLTKIPQGSDAIVVPVMLGVLKPGSLRKRLRGRGKVVPDRRAKRYLEHFDAIWRLQTFLLSEADRWKVPIIHNDDKDTAIQQLMDTITEALAKGFASTAKEVFR